jgi:large subunit ribosomal protein L3
MKFLLGTKKGMSQIFKDGAYVPVTVVHVEKQMVTQIKTKSTDGYSAVQMGYKPSRTATKPQTGHAKKAGAEQGFRTLREARTAVTGYALGQTYDVTMFNVGDIVNVQGTSKGRGFQGVVKRHGFAGSPATHGHKDQLRMPGSIGTTDPGRVFPGKRMGGHMGDETVTVTNLEIIDVQPDLQVLLIKGAVPGSIGGTLRITGKGYPTAPEQTVADQSENATPAEEKSTEVEVAETEKATA